MSDQRTKRLTAQFRQYSIDAFLVTKDVNIRYLTGFPVSESWLLVDPRSSAYVTDFRYVQEARTGLKGVQVVQYTKSIHEAVIRLARERGRKRIGIDTRHLSLSEYEKLKRHCSKGLQLVQANDLVENLREIKDGREIVHIKKALAVHEQALRYLKRAVKPKRTEKQILWGLSDFIRARGVSFSFDPIIASGPNSAYPHARVSQRKIRNGEPLLIDMGVDVEGYKSDLTRMFFLGKIPELVRQINDHVRAAQRSAIAKIKDGAVVADIDQLARKYLAKNKLDKYFGHALGHGVGLEIHEGPRLAQNNSSILKEGMVVTVEPAVYLPNRFGIRIEDMVLVRKTDCEILSDHIH